MSDKDTIYRQDAIDYFVTNVGFHDEDGHPIEDSDELRKIWTEYFDGIPSAQPEPCEDAVSRRLMYELGATCMARRDENGELVALGSLDALPSAQPKQRWIPCSERLPEENRYVLICTKHQAITDGRHERGTWWIAWDDRCYADEENLILAWMPQPAPYKEEGKDATD